MWAPHVICDPVQGKKRFAKRRHARLLTHKYCLPSRCRSITSALKLEQRERERAGLRTAVRLLLVDVAVVVADEEKEGSYPRNAKHLAVNRKREARRAENGWPSDYRSTLATRCKWSTRDTRRKSSRERARANGEDITLGRE